MNNNIPKPLNDRGVTAIVVALLLTVFLGIAALAVDIGYGIMVKNELQNAADAAALAGARQLGKIYHDMSIAQINAQHIVYLSSDNQTLVKDAAKNTASANKAAGVSVTLNDADITIGNWNAATKQVISPDIFPLAVQVIARNNNISTFFARIWGKQTKALEVVATATLSAPCTGGKSPFVISKSWFEPNNCPSDYLTWDGNDGKGDNTGITNCVAWRGNKQDVMPIMQCINGSNTDCPDSSVGNEVPYSNGTQDNLFDKSKPTNLLELFDYMKTRDNDGSDATWTTEVEVTDFTCGHGDGATSTLWRYVQIVISDVMIPDTKNHKPMRAIKFTSDCRPYNGRGGGCSGLNIVEIPSLVQ
ncbi:MAG: pilus assembly protein TadG-related protein [Smithella sp.]